MPSFIFQFDRISFWLGFLGATLFWWAVSRIRPLLPVFRDQIRRYFNLVSRRNFATVENHLRREVLRSAQRQHLAASLFSLDDILITPWLFAPPSGQDPGNSPASTSIASQVVPYLPDWPELAAPYGVPLLSPAQALQSGRNLVLIGRPGCGKTVALAHLASQLSRKEEALGGCAEAVPIYLHILDIDFQLPAEDRSLERIIKAVSTGGSSLAGTQLPRFLRSVFRDRQRKAVLLLDGLDELPERQLKLAAGYLSALTRQNPQLQIIAAASDSYLDGLTAAGFYPLTVAAWGRSQRLELAKRWGDLWNALLMPEIKKHHPSAEVDPALLESWLSAENLPAAPLEWTLRIWGAYAGDLSGSSVVSALDAHILRTLPDQAMVSALEVLAKHMIRADAPSLDFDAMDKILSKAHPVSAQGTSRQTAELNQPDEASGQKKKAKQRSYSSNGEKIINHLLQYGILVEHPNHQIRFSNPVFLGFLAGWSLSSGEAIELLSSINWPSVDTALQYAAAKNDDTDWVYRLIESSKPPLYRELFTAARWLRAHGSGAPWRAAAMRALAALAQSETTPMGIRARAVAAFYVSRDPHAMKLFQQLSSSKSPSVRRAAVLGFGVVGSSQLMADTINFLGDPDPYVRYAACMALAAIPAEPALNAVVEVLLTGDEAIRQAAAEALATIGPAGHKVLQEAASVDDLLTRRASVFGLMQVREPWARKMLEHLAIEDAQWVVRNAAAHALENFHQFAHMIPPPPPQPSATPWLIAFASRMGMGILPGHPATDVLMAVLKSGSIDEQIAALTWLRENHSEEVVSAIRNMLGGTEERLTEPVLQALWWMAASGVKV